jgi:post-segregation antitoxin (ccd killing protein)
MTAQTDKYQLAIAGEFFVAAQLQRLGISASVTYGTAKQADVVAVSRVAGKAVTIEVKSSRKSRWPIGNRVPSPSSQPWVFVHFPIEASEPPEFFVMLQSDLHAIFAPHEAEYMAKFKAKHNREYGDKTPGVAAATKKELSKFKDNWGSILGLLEI